MFIVTVCVSCALHECVGVTRVLHSLVIKCSCLEVMEKVETSVKTSMSSTQVNTDSNFP